MRVSLLSFIFSVIFFGISQNSQAQEQNFSSCRFTVSSIKKNQGFFPGPKNSVQEYTCHATLISKTQFVLPDEHCQNKELPGEVTQKLSCEKGGYDFDIPLETNAQKFGAGHYIQSLPRSLPFSVAPVNSDTEKRQDWLSDSSEHKCQINTHSKTIPWSERNSIEFSSLSGANISCYDQQKQPIVVGLIGPNGQINWTDEIDDLGLIESSLSVTKELNTTERTLLLCNEGEECLENIEREIIDLTERVRPILDKLKQEYQNQDLSKAHNLLYQDLQDFLISCQEVAWELKRSDDAKAKSGRLSSFRGRFERASLSLVNYVDEDFLVRKFMGIELISSQLGENEISEIIKDIKDSPVNSELSHIQLIAKIAEDMAKEVVAQMLSEMNPDLSKEENEKIWQDISGDYTSCLETVKNSAMITECSDKFGLSVPTLIGEVELERQVEQNFKELFENMPKENYTQLKQEVDLTFKSCLQKFYYNEESQGQFTNPDRVRTCVYEGLLSGYKSTARSQIQINLKNANTPIDQREIIETAALERAQDCDYGALFHKSNRMNKQDYNDLTKLSPEIFQKALDKCSENLTNVVGEEIVLQTVMNKPEIKEVLAPTQRRELSQSVISDYYRPCMQRQKDKGNKLDPQKCEALITELTTLRVAAPTMEEAIQQQVDNLIGLTEQEKKETSRQLIQSNQRILNRCHDELKEELLQNLITENSSSNSLHCLTLSIKDLAENTAHLVMKDSIENTDQTKDLAQDILELSEIKNLPKQTAECFEDKISQFESVEDVSESFDEFSAQCSFSAQKQATLASLKLILDDSLKDAIENKSERQTFINEIISKEDGLQERIESLRNQDELNKELKIIPSIVALSYASESIPDLVSQHLENVATTQEQEQISQNLIDVLSQCLDSSEKSEQVLNRCINSTTSQGYLTIIKKIVHANAIENLEGRTRISESLASQSQERLSSCLDKVRLNLDSTEYNKELESCVSHEIGLISRDIPREAMISVAPLMGTSYSESELRRQMEKVENFYLSRGGLDEIDSKDPVVFAHMTLNTCIVGKRADLSESTPSMEQIQKAYEECTDRIEETVKNSIKRNFVNGDYPGKKSSHREALNKAGDILVELTGKKSSDNSNQQDEQTNTSDTLALLELVGENTVLACNYDAQICMQELDRTYSNLQFFKRQNPEATGQELQDHFVRSPFMKKVIEANIAMTMRDQLKESLEPFNDNEGLLDEQILKITSPEIMGPILSNRYGRAVEEIVTRAIQKGEVEKVVDDPSTRGALGLALVENLENDGFVDELMYGLVQPELTQQKESSSGASGIFKNTKVTFGRLLGVVKGRDFDWNRIRQTREGRQARDFFANEILLPVLQGEDLSRRPSSEGPQKSLQDERMEKMQKLIEQGIKSLSQ